MGTYAGGWRIIRTMGSRLTDIAPPQGFGSETACAAAILASASFGFPLSTTQVVAGGVVGSGLGRFESFSSVNRGVFGHMAVAWILTLPGAAPIAGLAGLGVGALGGGTIGTLVVAALAVASGVGVWLAAQRNPVTPDNVNDAHSAESASVAKGGSV